MYARGAEGFDARVTVTPRRGRWQSRTAKLRFRAKGNLEPVFRNDSFHRDRSVGAADHLYKRSGTFWINMVSLRDGNDIFRADLLQKIKDLKPGFLRFPGGTYVQGNDRQSAFRWKATIGSQEMRTGHQDTPWSYWSTDHMGYHEYLLLCERLGRRRCMWRTPG